jgi:5-methylcytosine-specific restriction endonuclease McrA
MPKRFCLDCPMLIDTASGSRCAEHQAAYDRRRNAGRGTTKQRGLGGSHRRNAEKIVTAAQVCAICGRPPTPTDPLQADHTVPRSLGGKDSPLRPVHRSFNLSRGAHPTGGRCAPQ